MEVRYDMSVFLYVVLLVLAVLTTACRQPESHLVLCFRLKCRTQQRFCKHQRRVPRVHTKSEILCLLVPMRRGLKKHFCSLETSGGSWPLVREQVLALPPSTQPASFFFHFCSVAVEASAKWKRLADVCTVLVQPTSWPINSKIESAIATVFAALNFSELVVHNLIK